MSSAEYEPDLARIRCYIDSMYLDSRIVPQTVVKPGSFVGLMALYESNYMRLLRLIPELERLDGCFSSRVAGDCELYVEFIEHSRYTVTLSLTYRFETDDGVLADPDMTVRAYLDGQQAEVMAIGNWKRHAELRRLVLEHKRELDIRWRRNVILNKWLEYLSDQGHLLLER